MGRPERPLDPSGGAVALFAQELRDARATAGVTYRKMAAGSAFSVTTLAQAASGERLPSLPVALAYATACGGEADTWERRWHEASEALASELAAGAAGDDDGEAPYRGLARFEPGDRALFFGRDDLVRHLAGQVARHRLVAVVGASGSGKSSLLRAGLIPALQADGVGGRPPAAIRVLTPGPRPATAHAERLRPAGTGSTPERGAGGPSGGGAERGGGRGDMGRPRGDRLDASEDVVRRGGDGEAAGHGEERTGRVPGADAAGVTGDTVVIVDQLEEVFTLTADPRERSAFLDALAAGARDGSGMRVVVGVRADFFARCAEHAALAAALRDATVVVGPMDAASLRQVIVRPAAAAGLIVERSLTARMIREAEAEPGSLPLLSHALLETWRRRHGRALTAAMYDAAGGLHGAIAATAEDSYGRLSPQGRAVARAILLRLITPGDGSPDTRRPTPRDEVVADPPESAVLDHLVRARLLTVDGDTVDLAHEALIAAWPRYRRWIDDNRDRLRLHRALADAATTWAELDRDSGALLRGGRLTAALETFTTAGAGPAGPARRGPAESVREARPPAEPPLAEPAYGDHRGELTALETQFLEASRAAREAERRAQTRTVRRMRGLTVALSALLVLALVAAVSAVRQRTTAEQARDRAIGIQQVALSRQLAADSTTEAGTDTELSALLAVEAYRTQPTHEAEAALYEAAGAPLRLQLHGGLSVTGEAFSPDGRTLCWSEQDLQVRCTDTATGAIRAVPHTAGTHDLLFSGAHTIVTTDGSGASYRTDIVTGSSRQVLAAHGRAQEARLSADGRTQVTADAPSEADPKEGVGYGNRDVTVRDVATGAARARVHVPVTPRSQALSADGHYLSEIGAALLAVSPDGRLIATGGGWTKEREDTSRIRIWSTSTGRLQATLRPGIQPLAAAFSPDGRTLAADGGDGAIHLWNTETGRPASAPVAVHQDDEVSALAFAPDGQAVVAAFNGGALSLVDLAAHRALTLHPSTVSSGTAGVGPPVTTRLAFSADGRMLASGDSMGELRVWDVATYLPYVSDTAGTTRDTHVPLAALADGGRLLAVAGPAGPVRLVDARTGKDAGTLSTPGPQVGGLVAAPRGPWLAAVDDLSPESVVVWDLSTRVRRVLPVPGRIVDALAFSGDGTRVSAVLMSTEQYGKGVVRTWDTRTGRAVPTSPALTPSLVHPELAFSPDGTALAVRRGTELRLVDTRTGRPRATWQTQPGVFGGLLQFPGFAFSPDGRTLATSRSDGYVQLISTATGQATATLSAGASPAAGFAFSADGRSLAVAADDGTVRVWDLATARVRSTYDGTRSEVTSLAFSPDGSILEIGDGQGRTQLWHAELPGPAQAVAQICRAVGRDLSDDERARYLPVGASGTHACRP